MKRDPSSTPILVNLDVDVMKKLDLEIDKHRATNTALRAYFRAKTDERTRLEKLRDKLRHPNGNWSCSTLTNQDLADILEDILKDE